MNPSNYVRTLNGCLLSKALRKVLFLALLPSLVAAADIKVGMTEKELIDSKGAPVSSMRGPKKSILNWPDLKAEVVEGKVSAFTALSPEIDTPIGVAETEIMQKLVALHKKADLANGISKSDYISATGEIIDLFKENQSLIRNKKFGEACAKYLNAVTLFRTMLASLEWETGGTKETYYYVRKDRNLEIYNLLSEISPEERKKGIELRSYPPSFEVYEAQIVYEHINNKYWLKLGKIFIDNLDKTALEADVSRRLNVIPPKE